VHIFKLPYIKTFVFTPMHCLSFEIFLGSLVWLK
jgi:hypothetical protein